MSTQYSGVGTSAISDGATAYNTATVTGPLSNTGTLTTMLGCPVAHNKNSLTAGPTGPVQLQDVYLLEKVTQFAREKIPPRVVHSLGCGASGTFTVTNDITKYSKAKVFSMVGKKTPVAVRFSGTFTEQGEADTMRDLRGFACKFKTEEGVWDLMTINTPVFNCRDMKLGPDAVHAMKRDPRSGLWNGTQNWDFVAKHPEALHQMMMIWTDRVGTPISFRYIHGFGCNTYSFINEANERHWVKFHLVSQQGTGGFTVNQAKLVAGEDPNFLQRDLKEAIERGDYPKWKLCVQIASEKFGYEHPWVFDCSKAWSHHDFPLIEVGVLELFKNPVDHFTEVEEIAFSPANRVPGISFSPDKLLQGRLLIYDDTQTHRLGPNHKFIPINAPLSEPNTNYTGGGQHQVHIRAKYPHYYGSILGGPQTRESDREPPMMVDGPVDYYDFPGEGSDFDYYEQPRKFWNVLSQADKTNLCYNLGNSLSKCHQEVASMILAHFTKIDNKFGIEVKSVMADKLSGVIPLTEAEKVVLATNALMAKKVNAV